MKTRLKFPVLSGALLTLLLLFACAKEDPESEASPEVFVPGRANYNNGMIHSYSNDAVLAWNEALQVIDNKMPPPAEARIYAMVSLAMHDALNTIVPKYEAYAQDNGGMDASWVTKKEIDALADAAVSQAAYDVLTTLFQGARAVADDLLESSLAGIQDSDLKALGTEIGRAAAVALFAKRQNDFPLVFSTFDMGDAPGVFQSNYMPWALPNPNPPFWPRNAVYAANLGSMTPFGMATADQFRAVPPYGITSTEYARDYEEVKRLGCTACPDRSAEQTEIGAFFVENVSSSMNRLARAMAQEKGLDGWEAARLFALLHIAQIDANISSFEGKYYYNYWRPITAVRAGDSDGNPQTTGDAAWTPTFTTPPTPDYPSTHAYTGGAGAEVLKRYFGKDKISFTAVSPYYLPGVERTYTSFTQIGHENALSRIYIGYHFRKAVEEGEKMGRQLGAYIYTSSLKELKKNQKA
jgi:hypothetical protein